MNNLPDKSQDLFHVSEAPVSQDVLDKIYHDYQTYLMVQTQADPMKPAHLDLSPLYPETYDLAILQAQVDDLKRCLDSFRPLNPSQVDRLQEIFDLEYTYHSNSIEGNTLTLRETALVLKEGITIAGKTMKEHLEVINHQQAYDFVKELVTEEADLNKRVVLEIHALILHGNRQDAGRYRTEQVGILGSRHQPPDHFRVPDLMDDYYAYYEAQKQTAHPVLLAADMGERLVTIHPFVDGNGRTSRLVMNLLLLRAGYPLTIIRTEDKGAYFDALEKVQVREDSQAFQVYLLKEVKQMFFRYLNIIPKNGNERHAGKGDWFFQRIAPLVESRA
jgi:Fic family protein